MIWLKYCRFINRISFDRLLLPTSRKNGSRIFSLKKNNHSMMLDMKPMCSTSWHVTVMKQIQSKVYTCSSGHSKTTLLEPSLTQCHTYQCRYYAKKMKKAKGSKGRIAHVSDEEMEKVIDIQKMRHQMEEVVEEMKDQFIKQLSLRTSVASFENLPVKTDDGKKFPLNQLAQIAQKTPQLLIINMAASPQYLIPVKEALLNSGMNISPQVEATTIYVPIPKVTKEHRENLAKSSKTLCDRAKVKLRDIHSRFSKQANNHKSGYSEDLIKNIHDKIIEEMRGYNDQLDKLKTQKVQELTG